MALGTVGGGSRAESTAFMAVLELLQFLVPELGFYVWGVFVILV